MRRHLIAGLLAAAALPIGSRPAAAQAGHEHHAAAPQTPPDRKYPAGVPPVTDEDRKAAFPQLDERGHTVHDSALHSFVLFDQFEVQAGRGATALNWDNRGWAGGDVNRFWFRTEGNIDGGGMTEAQGHALFGRAIHRWWDLVAGVRQDFEPGPARTWAAIGIQGLAPYWFEVEATAYIGAAARTHFRLETEYELLLTNRVVLQPLVEIEIFGKSDPERGIGAGLSSAETGLRLRYEFRRELAPYVGVTWHRKFFGTADFARAAGEDAGGARLATGLRWWF